MTPAGVEPQRGPGKKSEHKVAPACRRVITPCRSLISCERDAGPARDPSAGVRGPAIAERALGAWPVFRSCAAVVAPDHGHPPTVSELYRSSSLQLQASNSPKQEVHEDVNGPDSETVFRSWTWAGPVTESQPARRYRNAQVSKELVPGLQRALEKQGLLSYLAAAEDWCEEMGAAFLEDLVSQAVLTELATSMGMRGMSDADQRRLQDSILAEYDGQQHTSTW